MKGSFKHFFASLQFYVNQHVESTVFVDPDANSTLFGKLSHTFKTWMQETKGNT